MVTNAFRCAGVVLAEVVKFNVALPLSGYGAGELNPRLSGRSGPLAGRRRADLIDRNLQLARRSSPKEWASRKVRRSGP